MELPSQLKEVLPNGYSYRLKKWTSFEKEPPQFETVILTNIYTETEAQKWWHEFNVKSNTTMRVRATCPKTGKVNLFKIYLRCLHQGRAEKNEPLQKSKLGRNTNCPAGMIVAIRRVIKYSRSKKRDPVDPVHPCEIEIHFVHNHPTKTADSLRFRPVSKEVEDKILSLYQAGHSPSSALETLKIDLQIEHGSLYSDIASDRYHCPDKSFCYRLYYKHFGKDYASSAKTDILDLLTSKISYYNNILGESCLSVGLAGNEYAISVCTPLMKQNHSLIQSGDIVYLELYESPINKDRFEHNILLMYAHTSVGGVPLGAVLTTSSSPIVLTLAFQLLKQLLPDNAFNGRGLLGPQAFFIEDSDNQKNSLNSIWPDADVIICSFRVLQLMWQWLWDEKHNISKDHRLYLLYLLKTVLFASSDCDMTTKYQALCSDIITEHYPLYLHQIESLWKRRDAWGICFHRLLPLLDANNYYEAAVRALKDKIFEQTRTFNMIQLLNFIVTRIDLFYRTKILNIIQGKTEHIFLTHFPIAIPSHIENNIKQIAGNYYIVPSENEEDKFYTIDAELNSCSCPYGLNGSLCIHQYWVFLKVPTDMFRADISDINFKNKLLQIVLGPSIQMSEEALAPMNDLIVSHGCEKLSLGHSHLENLVPDVDSSTFSKPFNDVGSEVVFQNMLNNDSDTSLLSHNNSDTFLLPHNNSDTSLLPHNNSNSDTSLLPHNNSDTSLLPHNDCSSESPTSHINTSSHINPTSLPVNYSQNLSCIDSIPSNHEASYNEGNTESVEDSQNKESSRGNEIDTSEDGDKNSDLMSRKVKALKAFENFCQRVKDGLNNETEDFLPALEIMMKNLERGESITQQIISGMSFFGVATVPSFVKKAKKRPAPKFTNEEILPKVHGRQMITYERRKSTNLVKDVPQCADSSLIVANVPQSHAEERSNNDR